MCMADHLGELKKLFFNIHTLLEKENGVHILPSIEYILGEIEIGINNPMLSEESFQAIIDTYTSMNNGKHPFAEFNIWREDYEERVQANKMFSDIKEKIQNILKLNQQDT